MQTKIMWTSSSIGRDEYGSVWSLLLLLGRWELTKEAILRYFVSTSTSVDFTSYNDRNDKPRRKLDEGVLDVHFDADGVGGQFGRE